MQTKQKLLSEIPSVDEFLKSPYSKKWLESYPRKIVLRAIRYVLEIKRKEILKGGLSRELSIGTISPDIDQTIKELSAYKLKPLINATGVVIHTNLGRAVLSEKAVENINLIAGSYSNLEYELQEGKRGKRYSHIKPILKELSGAGDALVVNNNAAAVLLCLNTFAKDREVIVSRGELVEIGGSFRIPEVMRASSAILREVGTTNKTHLYDYENALCGNTVMLLKVHQSNYKLIGFTEEVSVEELVKLGREYKIPVMADLGSGCMIDLEKYGIHGEPTVQSIIKTGVDIVTFSGDKLLGGPQAGIIVGKEKFVQKLQKNPLLRAVRIDKLSLASLEATLMQYLDEEKAVKEIPTLCMLTQSIDVIKKRAKKIHVSLRKDIGNQALVEVIKDQSHAGGGSLPEVNFPTFVVSIKPVNISVNELEERLRIGEPPVIARIKDDALLIDARTVGDREIKSLVNCVKTALVT
ncbi:MAG: L-seryl-tRNA(Sec) selenium transferase [Nitrospirae bacterium]|nr:L-seryl-tRNA(Sec) selenium transferase [Nitrospirota bacterium]